MTERSFTRFGRGPITLAVTARAADIEVTAAAGDEARISITTPLDHGPGHEAVMAARLTQLPESTAIDVPSPGPPAPTRLERGQGCQGYAEPPVTVHAALPTGSRLRAHTVNGNITVTAPLNHVSAHTTSGDIIITRARMAVVRSVSGDVRVGEAKSIVVDTVSGDIRAVGVGTLVAASVSGDITGIRIGEGSRLTSVRGDVEV